jgi:hypothetical protein
MSKCLTTVNEVQEYMQGVISKIDCHASDVRDTFLTLMSLVTLYKDTGSPIKVRTLGNDMKNCVWTHIGGTRFAFTYNHQELSIDMLEGSLQGNLVMRFKDSMNVSFEFRTYVSERFALKGESKSYESFNHY